jgi:hypothetical protein
MIPLWLDAGYRMNESVFFGGFFQYGFGFVGEDFVGVCDMTGVDCGISTMRLGAQIHYHVTPREPADFWLGYGFGYEWLTFSAEASGNELSFTAHGFEFANFQGGVDFMAAPSFYLGPFLSFSLGQYGDVSTDCSGAACMGFGGGGNLDDKALHEWFVIGIRGGYTGFGG